MVKYKKLVKIVTGETKDEEYTYNIYPETERRKLNPLLLALILLLGAYIVAAIVFNFINAQFLNPVEQVSTPELEFKFFVSKKEAYRGEPIKMTLVIVNKSPKQVALYFESEKMYEFIVKRIYHLGLFNLYIDVWRSSFGKIYKKTPKKLVIQPNQVIRFSEEWDQRLPNGKLAPPGDYIFLVKLYFLKGKSITLHTGSPKG